MIFMNANPDYETLKLILIIAGGVISVLLLTIGYFIRQQITASTVLAEAVNNLTVNVRILQSQQDDRHPVTERRLNAHAERLDEHESRIVKIETTCDIKYKKHG